MGGAYGASPIDRLKDFEAPLGLFLVFPAIGGFLGGCFCWRMITRGLPVSWPRALCIAVATSALSLLAGCVAGGLVIGLPFGALTLLWTLAWRFHVNRRAGAMVVRA